MALGDIYRASFGQVINGVHVANVMHFKQLDDEGGEVAADSLAAALEGQVVPAWVPFLSEDATIQSVVLKQILPAVDQPAVYDLAGGTGTISAESEPPNLAVVATVYSSDNSRTGRGRNYFSGIATTMIDGATPTAAFVALFATFVSVLMSSFVQTPSTVRWTIVQYSPFNDSANDVLHIEQRMQLRLLRERIKD
jgi:hypothetical protein